jgi:hypothetical protein
MQFNVYWNVGEHCCGITITKESDANNNNMFLKDNMGNEYHHFATGGCAAIRIQFTSGGGDCNGWFLFPAAEPEAKSFRFYDMDNLAYVDDIVLLETKK